MTLDFAELQGKTIQEDLARRDFTINAMARAFPDGAIVDPFGGRRDLKNKVIRALAARAFVDDPLRTLRTFRFSAQFQFKIENRTLAWIQKHRSGLQKVSAERIREELLRLFKQPCAGPTFRLMDRAHLLSEILPEMEACRRSAIRYYGTGGVLKHSFETLENLEWILERLGSPVPRSADTPIRTYLDATIGGYPRIAWLKWAAFVHDIGKPATAKVIKGRLRFFEHEHVGADLAMRLGQRLRLSRQEVQLLGLWVRNHMRTGNLAAAPRFTDKALSRFFRDMGEEGVGMVLVSLADHYTYLRRALWGKGTDPVEVVSRKLLSSYYEERSKILPERLIDGHLLMKKLRLKPGPVIGQLLEAVQDAQAEGKVTTRENAVVYAKGFLRRHPGKS
jgi:putative nucleotidyltransferase with HDIG domain